MTNLSQHGNFKLEDILARVKRSTAPVPVFSRMGFIGYEWRSVRPKSWATHVRLSSELETFFLVSFLTNKADVSDYSLRVAMSADTFSLCNQLILVRAYGTRIAHAAQYNIGNDDKYYSVSDLHQELVIALTHEWAAVQDGYDLGALANVIAGRFSTRMHPKLLRSLSGKHFRQVAEDEGLDFATFWALSKEWLESAEDLIHATRVLGP